MKKIIIIGGGIAGLTAGIFGKRSGYDVEIYEKNHEAGGLLTSWYRDGNIIDGCLHWMVGTKADTNLNQLWQIVGGLEDTKLFHPNSFYEVIYDDKRIVLYRDVDKLKEELLKYAKGNDIDIIEKFIAAITEMGESVMPSDVPFELKPKIELPKLSLMRKLRPFLNISVEEFAHLFESEVLQFVFMNSLVDKKFSVHYLLQTLANFVIGNASLPLGGSHYLRDKMVNKYLSLGGKIYYRSPVSEIIIENKLATGIKVGNTIKKADYIIPACDIHYTFNTLLKGHFGNPFASYDDNKNEYPTYSFVIASYKTKYSFASEEIATVHKVDTYQVFNKTFDFMSMRQYGYNAEFINNGYTTVSVMLPTYEDDYEYLKKLSKEEYYAFKHKVALIYKEKLEAIYHEEFKIIDTLTPLTYERFVNSYKGSFMTYAIGAKKPQGLISMLIPEIDNLVIANQWLIMPGGTPVAIISGKFAIQHILNKDGRDFYLD